MSAMVRLSVLLRQISAFWLVLAVSSWTGTGLAQDLPFRHYTPESEVHPLPSAEVQKIFQDDRGFIWFAVYSSGLARYDGERLDVLTLDDGLVDVNVWEIVQDRDGHLWVGSDGGLVVSERPLAKYPIGERPVFTDSLGGRELAKSSVRQNLLAVEPSGAVWAAIRDVGIVRYGHENRDLVTTDTFTIDGPHLFQSIEIDPSGSEIAGRLLNLQVDVTFHPADKP